MISLLGTFEKSCTLNSIRAICFSVSRNISRICDDVTRFRLLLVKFVLENISYHKSCICVFYAFNFGCYIAADKLGAQMCFLGFFHRKKFFRTFSNTSCAEIHLVFRKIQTYVCFRIYVQNKTWVLWNIENFRLQTRIKSIGSVSKMA